MSIINNLTTKEKVSLLKELYLDIAGKGTDGDSQLAHISPAEAALLKAHGSLGTINHETGLPEHKKAFKAVASIAAVAVGAYALGGGFGSGFSLGGLFQGLTSSKALQIGGLALNIGSQIKARKYADEQSKFQQAQIEEQKKAEATKQRYSEVLAQRERIKKIREAKFAQSNILTQSGGTLGISGTSGITGGLASIGTQTSQAIGNVNVAEGFGQEVSGYNVAAAEYGSKAYSAAGSMQGWTNMASLGSGIFSASDKLSGLFSSTASANSNYITPKQPDSYFQIGGNSAIG
jgi:hypothetical protein